MAGFLSGSTAMTVLTVDKPEPFSMDKLRGEAFRDEGPLGEKRFGFVGLGDKFDSIFWLNRPTHGCKEVPLRRYCQQLSVWFPAVP